MRWFVKSTDELHPNIELKPNDVIALGRSLESGISDKSVSKLHTLLKFQPAKEIVLCKHLGKHPALVNGVELKKGMKARIGLSSAIELIAGRYRYTIISESGLKRKALSNTTDHSTTLSSKRIKQESTGSPSNTTSYTTKSTTSYTTNSTTSYTTNLSTISTLTSNASTVSGTSPHHMSEEFRKFIMNKIVVEESTATWAVSKDLVARNDASSKGCSKVAVFDMDHTIITTKSGNVFPRDIDDWEVMWPGKVLAKLKEYHNTGYKLILMSNQSGIESKKVTVSDLQSKVDRVVRAMGVPVLFMAAPRSTATRKPAPGMWFTFLKYYNDNVAVDNETSFYVGDAAGRTIGWNPDKKKKKDFSSSDREFAENIGLPFHTPEEFFLGNKVCNQWEYKSFNAREFLSKTLPLLENGKTLSTNGKEMIIMVGYPGSGKSSFCKKHLATYTRINLDELKSFPKCVSLIESTLSNGGSVVIDNTSPDTASRKRYSDIAAKCGVTVRCFIMTTSLQHAKHNNRFRRLAESGEQVPGIVFNTFKSRYQEPQLQTEGFSDVVKVNFVPDFGNSSALRELYGMFLGG